MLYVPLYVEALRARPRLVFWLATLAQAALWLAVPLIFYSAPPGGLPQVLAIGHEFPLRGDFGPPLAYWLAEIAFRTAGMVGVYALAQICVITIYWCVFALGRTIMGATHAAMAVLLMVGISVFTVPSPDFGPPLVAAALWAVALLHYWRAVAEKRRLSWYVLGGAVALILLTTSAALLLLGLLVLFTVLTTRGRTALATVDPRIVAGGLVFFLSFHLYWLEGAGDKLGPIFERLRDASMAAENTVAWLRLLSAVLIVHAGLAILVAVASGWPRFSGSAAVIARAPADPFAVTYVKVFAAAPALLATIIAVLVDERLPVGGLTPLLTLSGLAAIAAAGDRIALHYQRILGFAWAGLLLVPVLFVPVVIVLLPWTSVTDLEVARPAAAIGRFFGESFVRRTGRPLAIVSGDGRLAALVALAAPSRPSIYFATDPERSPWVTARDIYAKGAVIVWPATETNPDPPPAIKARFPDLVAEVPETFERPAGGWLPPLRVGWGMIRPASKAR